MSYIFFGYVSLTAWNSHSKETREQGNTSLWLSVQGYGEFYFQAKYSASKLYILEREFWNASSMEVEPGNY